MLILERDVTATRAEFLHGVCLAFPGAVTDLGEELQVCHGDSVMKIGLTIGPERRIAALRLPTLRIRIAFTAGSALAQRSMLAHMDRAMHRGGG